MPEPLGLRLTRALARLLLRCYPRAFRRRWAADFVDAAAHRWRREFAAAQPAALATARTGILLCADSLGAVPRAWRSSGGGAHGSDPRRSLMERLMSSMAGTLSDLRTALRLTRRQAGTSLRVVATLALGIGVSAAAFSALDRAVLNALPYEHGDRMRYLALEHPTLGWMITPDAESVARWRQGAQTVERIETYRESGAVYLGAGPAESLDVLLVSTGLPGMLGVRPLAGRMLVEADAAPDAPAVVMIHETFWRRDLGGDPAIVGRDLRLTTGPATVVGIWPARARLNVRATPDLIKAMPAAEEFRQGGWTNVLGLLRPGVADETAAAELDTLAVASERAAGMRIAVLPPGGRLSDDYRAGLWLVFAAAAALLIVAVLNAANLLLGRATTRVGELGLRLALGGSPARIVRLFLAESVILAGAGAAAGVGVAWTMSAIYTAWSPPGFGTGDGTWLDARTVTFAALAALAATLAGALIPAWRSRAATVRDVLAAAGTRATDAGSRLRAALVALQAALAVLLVAGAASTGRSFVQLASVDPGFDVDPLAMVSVSASRLRYPTPEAQSAFIARVREAIEAIPQVVGITITNAPPFQTSVGSGFPVFEGGAPPPAGANVEVHTQSVDDQFFTVFGTPVRAGRALQPGDAGTAVIVNESFAREHGGNVVGRQLTLGGRNQRWYTVVGVVADVAASSLDEVGGPQPQVYFARPSGSGGSFARFVLRVDGDPAAVISTVRARVAEIDPLTVLSEASTFRELFDRQTARHRFVAFLLLGLALFGVIFAVSGVSGVVALEVARRRREVGLRVALGATAANVVGHLVRRGLRPVIAGAAIGIAASFALGPYLEDLLFRVPNRDPASIAAGLGIVVATAAIGCLLPARRAARVDPAVALREEP